MTLPSLPLRRAWRWFHKNLMVFVFVGVWVLVMLFINFNGKVAKNAADTKIIAANSNTILKQLDLNNPNSNLSKLKASQNADHDTIIKYAQCIINLVIGSPNQIVTKDDTDKCLAGTRIDPASTSSPAPQKTTSSQNSNSTNKNTTTNQNQQPENPQSPPGLGETLFRVPPYTMDLLLSKAKGIML